jgi:hypothetical protein
MTDEFIIDVEHEEIKDNKKSKSKASPLPEPQLMEAEVTSKGSDWVKKLDTSTVGELRKKYPKAFWIVGGIILVSLIF